MSSFGLLNIRKCSRLCTNLIAQTLTIRTKCPNYYLSSPKQLFAKQLHTQHVYYCTTPSDGSNRRQRKLPPLMSFPEIIWPSFINSIRNWVLINFIIRPYLDTDFNLKDFIFGAKHAVHVISSKLADSNLGDLKNLVSQEALNEIKPILDRLSVFQRKQLEINKDDIFLAFPYQVGIMFDESKEDSQKRFVEITMVFHVLRGFREMQNRGEVIPWNMGVLPEYEDKVFVCNYRFIKEFTSGSETDWTVNIINHFKPMDLLIDEQ